MKTITKSVLALFLFVFFQSVHSQTTFPVTIKVIDQTMGAKTNKTNDQNEVNLFAWLSSGLAPSTWTNWWYPLYSGEAGITGSQLVKNTSDWTWQATLNAAPGTYQWNPYMKTLGWQPMNKRILYYGATDNLSFTISAIGEITGTTQIVITADKFPVTLKLIDKSKGQKTNDAVNNNETNLYFQGGTVTNASTTLYAESIQPTGDWWYALYPGVARCTGANPIEKNDTAWIWSATINAASGCYAWNPGAKSSGWKDINSSIYVYNTTSSNIQFNVGLDGTISGQTSLIIPGNTPMVVNAEDNNRVSVYPTKVSESLSVDGAKELVEVYSATGLKIATLSAAEHLDINTSAWSSGLYLVVVDHKSITKIFK
ncbi:T9SS type A sorting domain-containing protein [Parabacteroides sp. FAFU027]|uniref:T9SS type A sorting domain-containing protein n=1 Tax=Parabacteroides sp. FAFU027 TaxID=2922715 RepID=UPI001FAEEC0C|nr:T9SS type A sorting domain-containing protein [Parabacteroides sp. FAFU027]